MKDLQKAVVQQQVHKEQQQIEEELKTSLLQNVHKLEQRRLLLQKELLMRSMQSVQGGTYLKGEHLHTN